MNFLNKNKLDLTQWVRSNNLYFYNEIKIKLIPKACAYQMIIIALTRFQL